MYAFCVRFTLLEILDGLKSGQWDDSNKDLKVSDP